MRDHNMTTQKKTLAFRYQVTLTFLCDFAFVGKVETIVFLHETTKEQK